jgi:endonuclease/exonuclease/phosphatase family metal-dependent hydrolase
MKYMIAAALVFGSVVCAYGQGVIRVGAWNIENLGSKYSRDYPKERSSHGYGIARKPKDVAQVIRNLNVDVLALTEIDDNDRDPDARSNSILDEAFEILNKDAANDWRYELFARKKRSQETQLTGIAWNRMRIQREGRRLRIPVVDLERDRYSEWDRHPHAVKFTKGEGRTDFVVVPVHMKSGFYDENDIRQRQLEAISLKEEFPELQAHFDDRDIILIGDFNMTHRNEDAGKVFRNSKPRLFDLNYYDVSTHVSGKPLDRCYIPRKQRENEFSGVRRVQIAAPSDKAKFRKALSDHYPIVLEFKEMADDD